MLKFPKQRINGPENALTFCLISIVCWGSIGASAATYETLQDAVATAGREFSTIGIEQPTSSLPTGFERQEDIVGGPGIRIPHYTKSYGDNEYDYAFVSAGIFEGKIAFKLFQIVQDDKTHCMNNTVKTVEYLQNIGIGKWQKHWRQDYQVAHWKSYDGKSRFSVTCRIKNDVWLLEEVRGLSAIK